MNRHYKHIHLIGIHGSNALVWEEKLFFPTFSLELKFIPQIQPTWINVINFIPFVIWYYKHNLLIRILNIDALVWVEKLFCLPFFAESKFIYQLGQTWILIKISSFFLWLGTINEFFSLGYTILMHWLRKKKTFLSASFLIIKFHPLNGINLDSHNNFQSFCDWVL